MAINNDRNLLEQQILSNSGLKGKELENLKARLATLSEQQLQAELSKSLSGNNKGEWYTGVMLEHNESVVMRNNHDQTTYIDDNGNEISELKDGDEVLERTIKSTDDKGNVSETTVTFSGGRPLTQTKTKNGNTTETTTYKYNDDADVPFVTVETKKADQSKVMTNVLEIDENGNFDNEDFIDRQTTLLDGTENFVVKENGRLTENVKKIGKPEVTTVYNGDNIQDLDSKKLNRLKQNDVYYDGKGNTYVQINAGETAQIMADRINKKRAAGQPQVTAQQIIELNPNLVKKNGEFVLQKFENGVKGLGEVKVPGEFDANSPFIRTRQSIQKANNLANQAEIDKQIATKVTENTDKKFAAELANNGFKPTRENAIFYNKFNALNPTQQHNVLSVIKYCKNQKITDPNKIKARILETFPEINLFDSGKTIPQTNNNVPSLQRKNPVALETFLTETLKLDLKSETGAMVYERLSSKSREELNKLNAQNFGDLSKANFVEVARRFEANGIDIRSRQEHQIENNSPRMKAEQEKRELRESASQNIALAYDNAINIIKQYQGNQGWINVGFYREKLGKLLSNVNPTKINTCFDDVIKELEKEKKFAVGYLKGKSTNDKEFKEAFKKVSGGVEYNEANMKAFLDVAQDPKANFEDEKYNEKFWNAYNKAFGVAKTDKNGKVYYEPQVVKQATSRTNFQQYVDGAGDIVLMLLGTEAIGKGVAWAGGKLISKVSPYVPKFLANAGSKTVMTIGSNNITVGRVAANMASQSASFELWDASKNYINLKTKDIQYSGEAAEKEWEAYKEGNVESAKFGAFAGLVNTTVVGKVINGTMKMFEKPIAKAVSKVGKSFETTSVMTGADVMKTFMLNQTPGMLAKTAGTIAEIGGFTLYETANEVIEELLKKGEGGHLPAKLTEDGLTSYLLDKLGDQAKNLGEIKAISRLIFMHKGAIQEQARLMDENLAKCETLKNVQIKKTKVNGREIFEVTMPDGNRKVANSVEEVIANCNVLMQLDMISGALKEDANNNYPSLSEIDKIARHDEINQANLSPNRFADVSGKKAQQQVGDYLDKLLENIPDNIPEVEISDVKMYADFILPDGTVISRNHAGDTGEIYRDPRTGTLSVKDVDNAVLFWIRDINGKEHVLPALSKSNLVKAKRLLGYMSTLQEVPRMQIVEEQAKILEAKKQVDDKKTTLQGMNAEEYRKTVADVKPEGAEENPLLTRLETANDRESFVAIRDEIKKMPNSEEKTQMMQAYLKKYNEWSSNPSRPDIRMQYIPENETINLDIKKVQETLNILSQKKGLKDIKDEVKNEIAKLVGNSLPENQDQMIKLIYKLKNAKEWWGEKTQEYNDEQLLQIIKTASSPDDSLNLIVLQRICKRMDGGPREDNSNMTRILPRDTKELNLARRSDGFFDEDLVLIGKKLTYAHQTREEIFKLLKDENGNPIKDLVDLVLTDKSENFDDGDMILGVLKSLYTDGKLNLNKVGQMKELVKDGSVSIYRAAHTMQSDMPADIIQNIGVFTQKGLSNNEVTNVINYLKSQNIKPTFDSVKNIIENCGNIPELRDIHVKKLLNQRGESIDKSYYEYVKKIAQHIEQIKQDHPDKANQYPKDIVNNYIKLLHIEGRSTQLKQHEILELLYDRGKDTCPFDVDKLVDSGLLSDIPGRDKPLQLRDLMRYQKEDTEVLKKAISRGLLSGNYSKILSLREVPSGVITSGGGKSKLEQLVELSDSELQFLQSMNTSDMLFGTAVGLAKCNPEQVKFLLETMNTHGSRYFANNYLRDSNFDLAYKMFKEIDAKMENHTTELTPQIACRILHFVNSENKYDAQNLFDNRQELGISADKIPSMLENKITKKQIQKAIKVMGKSKVAKLSNSDFVIACQFADLYGKKNINEIPLRNKRDLLRSLVSSNRGLFEISEELSKDFPLLPKNQEEYCSLLPSIVRSLGIETNELTPEQRITMFNSSMGELSKSLSEISDADFAKMIITQEYPKDKFILDVLDKVKALPRTERQKVYDYFGFELHHNKENSTGFSITGYPVNLNNGKKLAQIEDPRTKAVVEDLRPNIVRFSENNKIKCNNPEVERFLNEVIEALPELRTTIGKKQHGAQAFDVMQHSLKVMQKIAQDPKIETLNESDQKIMLLASLMHDIAKAEGSVDKQHANYGSFDSFFIAQKFNLTKEEEVKLHTLIKHHEWLEQVNTAKSEEQLKKRLQSVAYDLQQGNLFDMAEIFTHADLRAVRADDSFHDTTEGRSRVGFDGTVRSFGESANVYAERIRGYINELQKSQPLLPQTKVPRASRINEAITQVNPDGSTNIKGVYKDKDGLVVIKFNEVEDWEAIGFPKGSISHGIEIKKGEKGDAELSEDVNTGNIKFFVHGLNYSNQLAKFDAFSLVDSDALLSVSYAERPESKFRFFRPQGVLLDVNSKYIHGGGNTDSGSGCGKDIAEFKKNYIFGGRREYDRLYVSDLIKKTTGMTDEQYVEFVEINKDKPIQEIEPVEIRDKIVKAFATINSNTRKGKREYNEMYISNPNEVMGVFAYSIDYTEKIDNPVKFLNRNTVGEHEESYGGAGNISVKERTEFLRQYALERNLPFIIFGD